MITDIDDLRRRGIILVSLGGWVSVFFLGVIALFQGQAAILAASAGVVLNVIPTWCTITGRTDRAARLAIGGVVACQPLVVLFAMQGTPYQTDFSLYSLVALVALTLLWDTRPVLAACSVILVHHAVLSVAAPHLIFEGDGGLELFAIHSLAIILIGALLCWITLCLKQMMQNIDEARQSSAAQADELKQTARSLQDTLAKLKEEQQKNAEARAEQWRTRKAEYKEVAAEFERSVNAVTRAVADTSTMLAQSAKDLRVIAGEAGIEASAAVSSAESASKAVGIVAAGIAEISTSISEISVNVNQQSELTSAATQRSDGGGKAIGSLSQQSRTIGETTRAIVRVAERTNLLSLNAAIEAATAGPAGRGFTVVAQEVKSLANQASEAANEIDKFLSGVRVGTVEAERSFKAIEAAIGELNQAARAIRYDVETQQQSADTIETFARNAAGEADAMVGRTKALSDRATAARELSGELETAAAALAQNVQNLERSTNSFMAKLKAA